MLMMVRSLLSPFAIQHNHNIFISQPLRAAPLLQTYFINYSGFCANFLNRCYSRVSIDINYSSEIILCFFYSWVSLPSQTVLSGLDFKMRM